MAFEFERLGFTMWFLLLKELSDLDKAVQSISESRFSSAENMSKTMYLIGFLVRIYMRLHILKYITWCLAYSKYAINIDEIKSEMYAQLSIPIHIVICILPDQRPSF